MEKAIQLLIFIFPSQFIACLLLFLSPLGAQIVNENKKFYVGMRLNALLD
jgi:hypothetical protein